MQDNQYYFDILQKAFQKTTTRKNYESRLRQLVAIDGDKRDNNSSTAMYRLMSNPDEYYVKIAQKYTSLTTKKNAITLILTLFKHDAKLSQELQGARSRWIKLHTNLDILYGAQIRKNKPNDKQMEKYTGYHEIEAKYVELKKQDAHETLLDSLEYVLLSILVHTPPKRSDFGNMRIYTNRDPNAKEENYVVLNTLPVDSNTDARESYFVFNKYKTADVYKRVDEVMPGALVKDIRDSLRRHPRQHLFINRLRRPFKTNDAYGKFVVRTFEKFFGKKTGTTMLRHIYISEKIFTKDLTDEQKEEIARQMMHSANLQAKYRWNRVGICKSMCACEPNN